MFETLQVCKLQGGQIEDGRAYPDFDTLKFLLRSVYGYRIKSAFLFFHSCKIAIDEFVVLF